MKFLGIIPARYASTRFPGKPLADMEGKPMIQRVYEQVGSTVDQLYVATDDEHICETVKKFGGHAILTSEEHRSGTDRCYEAFQKVGNGFDVIINIQGDEPFIQPEQIELLKNCFSQTDTQIATLVKPFDKNGDFEQTLFNPNTPKVVLNNYSEALYFSRSVIPYIRGEKYTGWLKAHPFYKHIGLYAYRSDVLKEITALPPSTLEIAESLEQLRWLQNGYKIKVAVTDQETTGIDTPEDMEKALEYFRSRKACNNNKKQRPSNDSRFYTARGMVL
ncbi:MAG: 3-deoxy-manno-octulosonate cytidylyltransferase [Tannerella sp.]|jgi:3-deoxy-manno-octulosonate cytidylyltransferase (CMP-KDO synthetase)|nr:3-deoxy-manno-octulosonate cytidylyltransferase [Tannerella sp.]